MRIRAGDWFPRLWTFQEIVLAGTGKIYIAFDKEATISITDMREKWDIIRKDPADNHRYILGAGHPFSKAIRNLRTTFDYRVERVWEAVQHRQILNAEDERPSFLLVFLK
jgi:hypothetical protein